ncbi:MAG: WecB/TagA/CpsF family glycosyltransferase [Acidobacteriota bacterium]|nr:WecB/TagA/CpsF family glycosyltransferase [Acidobacteriota bacterium]
MKPDRRGTGLPVSSRTYAELEADLLGWLDETRCRTIMTMSFPMLSPYRHTPEYREAIDNSEVVLPDGMAIVWMSRWCKDRIRQRLSGPDFFEHFAQTASRQRLRYCLLGSTPQVLEAMRRRLAKEFPGIDVVATLSPPFGNWDEQIDKNLVAAVNRSRPDVLWVGITAPRQEIWLHRHKDQLRVPVAGAIGAAFDFFAGSRKRAPKWMQRWGLEWLFRVLQEPLRMLPRYLRSLPAAAGMIVHCRRRAADEESRP